MAISFCPLAGHKTTANTLGATASETSAPRRRAVGTMLSAEVPPGCAAQCYGHGHGTAVLLAHWGKTVNTVDDIGTGPWTPSCHQKSNGDRDGCTPPDLNREPTGGDSR